MGKKLSYSELLNLKRWNTPTVYNGWEKVTKLERTEGRFNREPVTDYMPPRIMLSHGDNSLLNKESLR